jgi:hypothetical protein
MAKAFVNGIGLIEKQEKSVEYTEDGTYYIDPDEGYLLDGVTVTVNTPEAQEKSLDVTSDGSYEVLPDEGMVLGKVTVNVDTPDKKEEQEKSLGVTNNGNYTVLPDGGKALSKVVVSVDVPDGSEELDAVSTALSDIINDQYELIPTAFAIKIDGAIQFFEFDEGMTWGEWLESEYNADKNFGIALWGGFSTIGYLDQYFVYDPWGGILLDWEIEANYLYTLYAM